MKKITFLTLLIGAFVSHNLSAQFLVKPTFFETTGVSNDGLVSGYEAQAGPYSIWNPDTNDFDSIGGAAPGQGVGGAAKFSADGKYLSGSNYIVQNISTDWTRRVLSDYDYIFKAIEFPENQDTWGYAAGQSLTNEGNGILLRTLDAGVHWTEKWVDTQNRGIEAMSFPTINTGYVGGWNHYIAKTTDAGNNWTELTPAGLDDVYIYKTINFKDELNGVITAQLQDNVAVYITADGGETWTTGSGLSGVPQKTCYVEGDTYFLVTNGGDIQKSDDNGLTWTTVYSSGGILTGISFHDAYIGIATGERYIYKTTDGGQTWITQDIMEGALLRDVKWIDDLNIVLVGTPDVIFGSVDSGDTWTWDNQTLFNGNPALYSVAVTGQNIHVCGSQGNFYKKSLISSIVVAEMSRYDTTLGNWTSLGSLGQTVDAVTSGGFSISGDGNTVVGNAWADPSNGNGYTVYAHGFAWNQTEGTIDLGSLYANQNRSSRANAVSNDGNVIVGYQDLNGPWKSAVWRKNPEGGYFPNEFLLVDPNGSATDDFNQLGECSAVSGDGNWIGGEGSYSNQNEPWIWSQATGLINLGNLLAEGGIGYGRVSGISPDGSIVIGWFEQEWGMPTIPFIWTAATGIQNLTDFLTTIGISTGDNQIWIPNNMSLNGKYITGWGFNPTTSEFGDLFTFRIELPDTLAAASFTKENVTVYPNPVHNILNINTTSKINNIEVYNMNGQLLMNEHSQNAMTKIDLSALEAGVYFVKTNGNNESKTFKVVKQ
ncbi:T9SS type A sorting domain-containing protein [Flavobacterium sp.]|uniref:T9SS type A sorting domain-containing protein n=1 Tax=Flavobacterium sp. TaxID=239 RepID=UPI00286D4259|nr:T9SS type A sorting domain-containing protein [Flavobacterium sp.]